MNFVISALISLFVSVVSSQYVQQQAQKLGGTVLQTAITDTIGTFRTNVNISLTNLQSDISTITSTQATYGTIVTANSPLPVANGGTSLSTGPTDAQYFGANGTTPAWKTLVASSGIQIATSTTSTLISTVGFDSTANIPFTGNNTHAGSEKFTSSTRFTNNIVFQGGSTSTFAGNIIGANKVISFSSSSVDMRSTTGEQTLFTFTLPASSSGGLSTSTLVSLYSPVSVFAMQNTATTIVRLYYGSTVVATITYTSAGSNNPPNCAGNITAKIIEGGVDSLQYGVIEGNFGGALTNNATAQQCWAGVASGNAAVDNTVPQIVKITAQNSASGANQGLVTNGYFAELQYIH